jgi:spore germination cell wall hydrolase CwlJ-like protein
MGRSRIGWAASIFAPWLLAFGLLVSLAAHADPDPDAGGLTFPPRSGRLNLAADAKLIAASYAVGEQDELASVPDEIEPRYAPKRVAAAAPVINRAGKGDPFVALRPGFEAKAGAADFPADSMSPAGAASAPVQVAFSDGATPAVPLGFALVSNAPSPAAASIPAAAVAAAFVAAKSDLSDRPGYATLIDPRDRARQLRCLAEALYFEARSEPEAGQAAVAQVVLNRVRSGIYPTTVCGVVYQDRERPFACQFSFACEGKSLRVEEPAAWATATRIAEGVADGKIFDPKLASAINYHAVYVRPFWAPTLQRLDRIGLHVFYAMRPGLYWAPGALSGHGDAPPLLAQAGPAPQNR